MAYTQEEIQAKIQEIVSIGKPFWQKQSQKNPFSANSEEIPEYWSGYRVAVDQYERIRVHAEYGVFPERLLKLRSPNEEEKEQEFRRNNYKQTTLPVFKDFDSTVQRIFHDSNWSIEYSDEEQQFISNNLTFRDYVENQIHTYGSIENFVKFILSTSKLKDANGVVAVKPVKIPTITKEDGEVIIDSQKLVDPVPFYYNIKQLVAYEEEDYAIIETSEKSVVEYANSRVKDGKVFEFYDNEKIWIVKQYGKKVDYTFTAEPYFTHNSGEMPVHKLMGVPTIYDGKLMYQSPFLYAVDNLDLVALDESNLLLSKSSCVYPYKIMLGSICEFETNGEVCKDGYIFNKDSGKQVPCSACHGSGLRSRMSPLGTMLLRPADYQNESETKAAQDPLKYVSPDITTLKFLREEAREHEARARKILHLQASEYKTQFNATNETATGSNNDLKALYAFLKPISDQCFTLYEWILKTIGKQRYGISFKQPSLSYPQTFDFKTTEDYLTEINDAIKVGMPVFVVHTHIYKYLQNVFYNDEKAFRVFNLITASDRLLAFTTEDIAMMIGRSTAARWEEILHNSSVQLIDELVINNADFFDQELTVQVEQLKDLAKAKEAEIAPVSENVSVVEGIVGGGSFNSVEAEAKAKLKGTVGGVQGIIQINQAVSAGEMTESAAKELLIEIYGFSQEIADRLIEKVDITEARQVDETKDILE